MPRLRTLGLLLALAQLLPLAAAASPAPVLTATGVLFPALELRPGVHADIHVTFLSETRRGDCLLVLHGGPFTAESWRAFAAARGDRRCTLGLDMPARGLSSAPTGAVFGELLLDDYVSVVLGVLERLDRDLHLRPRAIAGHSLGGIVLQRVQQRLVDEGTHLRRRFGVREAILVAPDFPQEVPWAFGDNGGADAIAPFLVSDPVLGTILRIPAELWPAFFFVNRDGQLVPGAPTPAEITAGGWVAPGEPGAAIAQLLGAPPFTARPSIQAGIFERRSGTRLRVVGFAGDGFILLEETPALYRYLSGDASDGCFVAVPGADTVHATHMSSPQDLVEALEASEHCRVGR